MTRASNCNNNNVHAANVGNLYDNMYLTNVSLLATRDFLQRG